MLGLLCMPAEVVLGLGTAFQSPSSISFTRVNSSAEITCTTSLKNPMGLYVYRQFHSEKNIVYLDLTEFSITKNTICNTFAGRLHITPAKTVTSDHHGFTFQLSLLGVEDTNLYYCSWLHTSRQYSKIHADSNGTVIIIKEGGLEEQCRNPILDLILICSSIGAFTVILLIFIIVLIMRCKRYKKKFRPAVPPPRPPRPQRICPHHHRPYLVTSVSTDINMDFRGLL